MYFNTREPSPCVNADDTDYLGAGEQLTSFNPFTYCLNNPVNMIDETGKSATLALTFATVGASNSWNPVGWICVGIAAGFVIYQAIDAGVKASKSASKSAKKKADPYARPGQKKQGRENKYKNRTKSNYKPRNNRRDNKPAKPKKHTPSKRGHKKY